MDRYMERYDIRSVRTIQKIMDKGGDGEAVALQHRPAMFSDGSSYFESLVQAIIRTISKLQALCDKQEHTISALQAEIANLKREKESWAELGREREEDVLVELVNLTNES